jgi:hypothetical protein
MRRWQNEAGELGIGLLGHGFHPCPDLGRLASLDTLTAGSDGAYYSLRHQWSTTGRGPRSESDRHWRAGLDAGLGEDTALTAG